MREPAVRGRRIRPLQNNFAVPENVTIMDAGTGVRNMLFDIVLGEGIVKKVIVVDAIDAGRVPGEILEIDPSQISAKKLFDFSMHQLPTSNLLQELKDLCGVDVKIISVQVENIPEFVRPGLSETIARSLPAVCMKILEECASA
ncbi:MAG: hyaD2 [Actinobacteria bacterium]|nr:hyaD2 [Actinomycetota bacterium]